MGTRSTSENVCSQSLREKVAKEWVEEKLEYEPEELVTLLNEIAVDGFTGFRHEDDREVFAYAMMYGLLEEE